MNAPKTTKFCFSCGKEGPSDLPLCIYCGIRFVPLQDLRWFNRPGFIITMVLSFGPFALPLVWFHPKYSQVTKLIITLIVIIGSYYLWNASINSMKSIMHEVHQMGNQTLYQGLLK